MCHAPEEIKILYDHNGYSDLVQLKFTAINELESFI